MDDSNGDRTLPSGTRVSHIERALTQIDRRMSALSTHLSETRYEMREFRQDVRCWIALATLVTTSTLVVVITVAFGFVA